MSADITGTHPYAAKFPMLSDAEIDDLAESIATVGLLHPIVVDPAGLIVDGRNRLEACNRAQVEAQTVVYDGADIAGYVIACNVTRRNMSTGARAMATALVLLADGCRENGRWDLGEQINSVNSDSFRVQLSWAGTVLDFKSDLAEAIISERLSLKEAYGQAKAIKDSAERDKIMAREKAKREKAEAAADAERNAQIVADLTQAESKYVALIEDGTLTPAAAWQAFREDTRKERERADAERENARDQVRMVARGLISLEGMQHPEWRDRTKSAFARYADAATPSQRELHNPNYLRDLSKWLTVYADELEQQ